MSRWICALALLAAACACVTAQAARRSLKAAAAEEMWLAVAVNGQLTGTTALVRYDHADNLWVSEEELKNWRLTLPADADTSLPDTPLYSLKAYPGLKFHVDETAQTLAVDAPAKLFDANEIGGRATGYVAAAPAPPGGFFNYDLVGRHETAGTAAS